MTSLVTTPDATMASDRVAHITEAQKQALMDNLQLESTLSISDMLQVSF
jgi:hypothetical protein